MSSRRSTQAKSKEKMLVKRKKKQEKYKKTPINLPKRPPGEVFRRNVLQRSTQAKSKEKRLVNRKKTRENIKTPPLTYLNVLQAKCSPEKHPGEI
jgi:hypothetical protein